MNNIISGDWGSRVCALAIACTRTNAVTPVSTLSAGVRDYRMLGFNQQGCLSGTLIAYLARR